MEGHFTPNWTLKRHAAKRRRSNSLQETSRNFCCWCSNISKMEFCAAVMARFFTLFILTTWFCPVNTEVRKMPIHPFHLENPFDYHVGAPKCKTDKSKSNMIVNTYPTLPELCFTKSMHILGVDDGRFKLMPLKITGCINTYDFMMKVFQMGRTEWPFMVTLDEW